MARISFAFPGFHSRTNYSVPARLNELLSTVEVGEAMMLPLELRGEVDLPVKDWPVLSGAAAAGATHLITGDVRHFGRYFGERLVGVLVMRPADYLKTLG